MPFKHFFAGAVLALAFAVPATAQVSGYQNPDSGAFERVQGENGSLYVTTKSGEAVATSDEAVTKIDGAAFGTQGVGIMGFDGTNAQALSTDTAGRLTVRADGSSTFPMGGNVASGVGDTGAPVKVGCVYNSTLPTVTTGQRVDCQADSRGRILAFLNWQGQTGVDAASNNLAYATDVGAAPRLLADAPHVFNGVTWDRVRGSSTATGVLLTQTVDSTGTALDYTSPVGTFASYTSASTGGIAPTATTAASSGAVLKSSAGNLYSVSITTGASAGYLMVFDATAVPADGAVTPKVCRRVAATSTDTRDFAVPLRGTTGLVWAFSTGADCFTLTKSATAFVSAQWQ